MASLPHYRIKYDTTRLPHSYVEFQTPGDTRLPHYRVEGVGPADHPHFYVQEASGDIEPRWLVAGTELLQNGGFATDTVWTKGTGWTISGGVATRTNAGSLSGIAQPITFVAGGVYRVVYTVTARTSGTMRARFSGGTNVDSPTHNVVGTFTETMIAGSGNITLSMVGDSTWAGSIDNVLLIRIG